MALAGIGMKEAKDMAGIENAITRLRGQRYIQEELEKEDRSFWDTILDPFELHGGAGGGLKGAATGGIYHTWQSFE